MSRSPWRFCVEDVSRPQNRFIPCACAHEDKYTTLIDYHGSPLFYVSKHNNACTDPDMTEMKKAHKQAVKEEKREKRKNKTPKHVKKRKEKVIKQRHGK